MESVLVEGLTSASVCKAASGAACRPASRPALLQSDALQIVLVVSRELIGLDVRSSCVVKPSNSATHAEQTSAQIAAIGSGEQEAFTFEGLAAAWSKCNAPRPTGVPWHSRMAGVRTGHGDGVSVTDERSRHQKGRCANAVPQS